MEEKLNNCENCKNGCPAKQSFGKEFWKEFAKGIIFCNPVFVLPWAYAPRLQLREI